jgi:hypothetical protein
VQQSGAGSQYSKKQLRGQKVQYMAARIGGECWHCDGVAEVRGGEFQLYETFRQRGYDCGDTPRIADMRSGRAMRHANSSIADEVEAAIAAGSTQRCAETARRVTALFLASAGGFNEEQIALFADVFERLINTMELRAIAEVSARIALTELSTQLAPVRSSASLGNRTPRQKRRDRRCRPGIDGVIAPRHGRPR